MKGCLAPARLVDLALIKAIARGRQWAGDLLAGRMESVAGIAERERVQPHYVRRLLRSAFLAPKIVEAIAAGVNRPNLPPELCPNGSNSLSFRTSRNARSESASPRRLNPSAQLRRPHLDSGPRLGRTVAPHWPTEILAAITSHPPESAFSPLPHIFK